MIDFIVRNKEWLFSGVGISFLGIVIVAGKWLYAKRTAQIENSQSTTAHVNSHGNQAEHDSVAKIQVYPSPSMIVQIVAPAMEEYSEHPTAKEISDRIKSLPLYQQNGAWNNYLGLKVKWRVSLSMVHECDENFIEISCKDSSGYPRFVMSEVSLNDYPRLKFAEKGELFSIYGEILRMESSGFWLRTDRLEFSR